MCAIAAATEGRASEEEKQDSVTRGARGRKSQLEMKRKILSTADSRAMGWEKPGNGEGRKCEEVVALVRGTRNAKALEWQQR